jgi:hypothetical protein
MSHPVHDDGLVGCEGRHTVGDNLSDLAWRRRPTVAALEDARRGFLRFHSLSEFSRNLSGNRMVPFPMRQASCNVKRCNDLH